VFPGWHDEPALRDRALAELRAAVVADPSRASAQEALRTAESFAAADKVDPAPPRPEIRALDAALQALQTAGSDPRPGSDPGVAQIIAAVEARAKAQADPAPFFTGAQMLIERGEYDRAIALAERGASASDRFISENLSAYLMSGKAEGSRARGHALAADLVGWAQLMKKNYAAAAGKLGEAERLTQGQDFVNRYHLGELARAQNMPARARDHYLDALSLAAGPAPLRQKAKEVLAALQPGPNDTAGFDAWLEAELTRRRDDRKAASLKSLVDKPLPALPLTTIDGKPYDTAGLRGKVLLLNFFASW
jgi:tetratricopeptide (TPR) repeat protein